MPGPFQYWFFNQLPSYFKIADSYKDINDRGLIERYLEIFGLELDQEYIPQIENYVDIVDPLLADTKFLNHIAYTLGNPPDLFPLNEAAYRRLLAIIISIYKVKGTQKSYEAMFALLGYLVHLQMFFVSCTYYDDGKVYDEDPNVEHYDTCCEPCVSYNILISDQPDCIPLSSGASYSFDATAFTLNELVEKILCLIEPINAQLENYIPTVFACEIFSSSIDEEVGALYMSPTLYDADEVLLYDDGNEYDSMIITPVSIYP